MKMSARGVWEGFRADGAEWVILETSADDVPEEVRALWLEVQDAMIGYDPDNLPYEIEVLVDEVVESISDLIWRPHY